MSNELSVVAGGLVLPEENVEIAEAVDTMVGASDFRRIQLCGSNNKVVKQNKFPMGHFAIVDGDDYTDLSEQFDALVLEYRLKAMDYSDDMIICYDPKDEEFQRILAESKVKDSKCMFGPEFLLWVPEHGFLPYYLNNKSSQFIAGAMKANRGKIVTLEVTFIETKEFSWHAPKLTECLMPFETFPAQDDVTKAITAFNNPDVEDKERAEDAGIER